ncbi:hypothetical protein B0H12DRAFT_1133719 [Mycena haematopus]|nr:hypothetical protein B0H12DRAFT_1133719 [Mycena haematopus]
MTLSQPLVRSRPSTGEIISGDEVSEHLPTPSWEGQKDVRATAQFINMLVVKIMCDARRMRVGCARII